MFDYPKLVSLLKETALSAGEEILKIYHSDFFDIELKSDDSPITRADLAAHHIIAEQLKKTPYPVLSEEGKSIPYEIRKNWETLWIVDPIDGTKEFIKRNDEFTVNIALVHQNKPVLGVIYAPALGKLYYGGKEIGAFIQEKNAETREMKIEKKLKHPIRIAVSRSHLNKKTRDYIQSLEEKVETVPVGSSLKFMLLAENKVDIYPRFGPCMEWDSAAAHAILRALNIEVISMDDNQPLTYNKKNLYNPYFFVRR